MFRERFALAIFPALLLGGCAMAQNGGEAYSARVDAAWKVGDRTRPMAPVITPGTFSTQAKPGLTPSDAAVLFDGKDLSKWLGHDGGPARWTVGNGYFEVKPGAGDIHSAQAFGDCQLHVEWQSPNPPHGKDQDRGNSGIYLMSLYETQVLDSYGSETYADGQAASIYGQFPPLVNVMRPPGEWEIYDIVFHGPRFGADGKLTRPASETVLQNGVLVQDNSVLTGPTDYMKRPPYKEHAEKQPLLLQDHGSRVRYRNIWIRELKEPGNL